MLRYTFSFDRPATRLVQIKLQFELSKKGGDVLLQLPSWRPGRYELGNFSKNILGFKAFDESGRELRYEKMTKDLWKIDSSESRSLRIEYSYYAAELNAGSTYLDDEQLYVNPVNCCMYPAEMLDEKCIVELDVPNHWKVATGMPGNGLPFQFETADYHQLADSPFVAGSNIQHFKYAESNHDFHVWFVGNVEVPWARVEQDFRRFSAEQIRTMGALPAKDYHFIFQILPTPFYHGVEHLNSTVCALGPGYAVFDSALYNELLGVSSHELFHAWNVKAVRPSVMTPYNYTRENYSSLGWVYEGVTTYYGDQFLIRSGAFTMEAFFQTFNEKLKKHFSVYGRYNQPVAEASVDTWVDGYVPGVPNRKTSIYTEGSLCSFLLDMIIRESSGDERSLDDFMRGLIKNRKGYTKEILLAELKGLSDYDYDTFYRDFIERPGDLEPLIRKYLSRVGLEIDVYNFLSEPEHKFGFTLGNSDVVNLVAPDSPAAEAGLSSEDQIIAVDGIRVRSNLQKLLAEKDVATIAVFSREKLKQIQLKADSGKQYFQSRILRVSANVTDAQKKAFQKWTGQQFPA